jgi:patatin-related protein
MRPLEYHGTQHHKTGEAMSISTRSREVRFGIVMYGGVSLAIYINGVSQELFNAVQGRGIYKLLKACLDIDIIVDIISGTSAGGINGLLLGYALANGKDFETTKELWRRDGDIGLLLNQADAKPENCNSLLNSDQFYRRQLTQAFADLDAKDFRAPGCELSPFDEMDVFITGTSFEPDVYTTFDDGGRPIDMQDYRKVFKLKHRAARRNKGAFLVEGLGEKDRMVRFEALAKLARITSCFPGAFLPVRVLQAADWGRRDPRREEPRLADEEDKVDATLCEWGELKSSAYFLDGGVLDNKPFTPTIAAIFGRTTDRPVDRMLFYVEPDPEVTRKVQGVPCQPNFLSSLFSGIVGISTYQSTTDDARELEEHNSKVVRHTAVCAELKDKFGTSTATGVAVPQELQEPQRSLYISTRNTSIATRAMRGILRDNATGAEAHMTSAADRERVKQLFRSLNQERAPDELPYDETFQRYDIYFRQRRLNHTIKWTYTYLSGLACDTPETKKARDILQALNQHVQLLDIMQHWFDYALDRVPVDWKAAEQKADPWSEVWGQVSSFFKAFLSLAHTDTASWLPQSPPGAAAWLSTEELDKVNDGLRTRVNNLLDPAKQHAMIATAAVGKFNGLLQWTDEVELLLFHALKNDSEIFRKAKAEYDEFVQLDAIVFPLDFLSNLESLNEVKLLRISPSPSLDEQNRGVGFKAESGAEDKLAGRLLAHFSGFLKRSWRSNDILWGRLDGLRHIVLAILTLDTVKRFRKDPNLRLRLLNSIGGAAGVLSMTREMFGQSPSTSHRELADFFELLLSHPEKIDQAVLQTNLNLLIEMGQLEIISEEIGTVLKDAGEQQTEWNRYRELPKEIVTKDDLRITNRACPRNDGANFTSPSGWIDPALIGLHIDSALAETAQRWQRGIAAARGPKSTALGSYFERDYDVACEGLERGIPPLILAEHLTRTLLVINACLVASLPPAIGKRVAENRLYKLSLRMPLRFSHRIVKLWLREPKMTAITLTATFVASFVGLLVIGYFYAFALLARHGHSDIPGLTTALLLFTIPSIIFVLSSFLLWKRSKLGL